MMDYIPEDHPEYARRKGILGNADYIPEEKIIANTGGDELEGDLEDGEIDEEIDDEGDEEIETGDDL